MRTFNKREKDILNMLFNISNETPELFSFYLKKKYFQNLTSSALLVLPELKKIILHIPKIDFDDLDKRKRITIEFIEFLSLIKFLKDERYIDIIQIDDLIPNIDLLGKDFDKIEEAPAKKKGFTLNERGDYIIPSHSELIMNSNSETIYQGVEFKNDIYKQVVENCMGLLFVSEELREFVKNKYKSKEDLRYRYGQIFTWIGIMLALVFGVLGLNNPFDDHKNKVSLDSKEIAPLIKNTKDIHQDMHKIMKNFESKKDSLSKQNFKSFN
jgi:hypothetical protein